MTFDEFKKSLNDVNPPTALKPLLLALWYDGKGDWQKSHEIAQDVETSEGSWVHAYLHRKEGDDGNASYWYARGGKKMPASTLEKEWENIVESLLASKP